MSGGLVYRVDDSVCLPRRRRWRDRRRTCQAGMGIGGVPPASVSPAAALRVGGGGRARDATSSDRAAAGGDETGSGLFGRRGALVCCRLRLCGRRRPFGAAGCRRRRYGRLQLCALGAAGAREASICYCSVASVGKTSGACLKRALYGAGFRRRLCGRRHLCVSGGAAGKGGAHVFLFRRRRRQDRWRVPEAGIVRGGWPPASLWPAAPGCVGGGSMQERRSCVTVLPPASARPPARA